MLVNTSVEELDVSQPRRVRHPPSFAQMLVTQIDRGDMRSLGRRPARDVAQAAPELDIPMPSPQPRPPQPFPSPRIVNLAQHAQPVMPGAPRSQNIAVAKRAHKTKVYQRCNAA